MPFPLPVMMPRSAARALPDETSDATADDRLWLSTAKAEWSETSTERRRELALIVSCLIGSFGPLGSTAPYHLHLSALRSPASDNIDRMTYRLSGLNEGTTYLSGCVLWTLRSSRARAPKGAVPRTRVSP